MVGSSRYLARMDSDGFFQIIDRKKDMILAGPYNVYPRDVEEVLYENPKVFEVAVTAVPQHDGAQTVKAYVVLKKGEMATPEEFIHWKEFGLSIEENTVHGSDAPETAAFEIPYFFSQLELV